MEADVDSLVKSRENWNPEVCLYETPLKGEQKKSNWIFYYTFYLAELWTNIRETNLFLFCLFFLFTAQENIECLLRVKKNQTKARLTQKIDRRVSILLKV